MGWSKLTFPDLRFDAKAQKRRAAQSQGIEDCSQANSNGVQEWRCDSEYLELNLLVTLLRRLLNWISADSLFAFSLRLRAFASKSSGFSIYSLLLVPVAASITSSVWGDGVRQLTTNGRVKFAPVFVGDGNEIAWCEHDRPNRVSIIRLNLKTNKTTTMYSDASGHFFDPAFSADRRYLCFGRSGGPRQLSLVIVDTKEGKEAVFEPPGGLRATIRTPRFFAAGQRVLFTINAPGGQQIASVNLNGQDYKRLTDSAGINGWPDVSRDGKQIVFSSSRDGALKLYLMNSDGNGVRQLTQHRLRDVRPAFSPDGKRIAFTSARDGNDEIYSINNDGSGLTRLTNHAERDDYPVWHPDGKQLAWIAERNGKFDLYLMPVDD